MHGRSLNLILTGMVQQALGSLSGVEHSFEQATQLEKIVASDHESTHWQCEYSVSLIKMGNIKSKQGNLAGAPTAYRNCHLNRLQTQSVQSSSSWIVGRGSQCAGRRNRLLSRSLHSQCL